MRDENHRAFIMRASGTVKSAEMREGSRKLDLTRRQVAPARLAHPQGLRHNRLRLRIEDRDAVVLLDVASAQCRPNLGRRTRSKVTHTLLCTLPRL
jgi:hypothetical protein